jgi:outer membrane protein OmpA-like peptidoglycan-associated protein
MYNPTADSGKKLLAHELTHVSQQSPAAQLSSAALRDLTIGPANDAWEEDASRQERVADSAPEHFERGVLNYGGSSLLMRSKSRIAPQIQRDLDDPGRFSKINEALFASTPSGGKPQFWKPPSSGVIGTTAEIVDDFKTKLKAFIQKNPLSTGGDVPTETTKDDANTDIVASDKILRAKFPQITSTVTQAQLEGIVGIITPQQTSDPVFLNQWLMNRLSTMTDIDNFGLSEKDPRVQDVLKTLLADSEVGPSIRILASRTGAFTEGEGSARKVSLHRGLNDSQRKEVLLHELVHFYVHPTFQAWIAKSTAVRFFEEGFTEYLARLAMTPDQLKNAKSYQDRFDKIKKDVSANASDDDIARAYFSGEVWLLEGKTEVSKKALEDQTGLKSKVAPKEERDESKTSEGIAETVVPGSHYRFMNLGNEESDPKSEHKALFAEIQKKYLGGHPDVRCRFVGHASSPGTDAFNMALSLKRALAFYQMARDAGVLDSQLVDADKPRHFGERQPTAKNDDVRGRAFNRRVELFLVPAQPATGPIQQARIPGTEQIPQPSNTSVPDVLHSPGMSLDSASRSRFEPRFGKDFGHVRVHVGPTATESARSMNALAYATGNHLVFGAGQYDPKSLRGQQLLVHELTHIAQQSSATLADPSTSDRAEREAAQNGHRFSELGFLSSFEPVSRAATLRQDADNSGTKPAPMAFAQFEDVMKKKFRVSSVRIGTFNDQAFGDMKQSQWQQWPASAADAPYAQILEGIDKVVSRAGGMPPVREIIFYKVAYEKDSNTPPTNGIDHVVPNPDTGASFSAGRLEIFEAVSRGNPMLDLSGRFQTPSKEEAVRRNISHELGHSVVEEGLDQGNIRPGIDPSIIADYKLAAGWLKGPLAGDPELLYDAGDPAVQAAIVNHSQPPPDKRIRKDNLSSPWKERPLTTYGASNVAEDFGEAFMAYVNSPEVLKKFAPRRFEFIDSRKSRWASRLVNPNQPAQSGNPQQGGASGSGQNRGKNLPLRKDFNKEIEKSAEDVGL